MKNRYFVFVTSLVCVMQQICISSVGRFWHDIYQWGTISLNSKKIASSELEFQIINRSQTVNDRHHLHKDPFSKKCLRTERPIRKLWTSHLARTSSQAQQLFHVWLCKSSGTQPLIFLANCWNSWVCSLRDSNSNYVLFICVNPASVHVTSFCSGS